MSNPYRAKPARSRVDHNLGYGAHNQNMWNPIPRVQADMSPIDSMQQQSTIMNQSKQTADPWNNSWNCDFGKQTDNQHQQQQQQQPQLLQQQSQLLQQQSQLLQQQSQPQSQLLQQQSQLLQQQQPPQQEQQQPQHYMPPYKDQGQLISNSIQDHYYQNVNGNKTDLINQNSIPDGKTHVTGDNRQPIHSDSYQYHLNSLYQQYQPLRKPSSGKFVPLDYDRSQWINEPQSQLAPYPQQRSSAQSQEDQAAYNFLAGNNYNWHKPEQMNSMPLNNCQSNMPGDWQDTDMDTEAKHFDDMGNQCLPLPPRNRSNQNLPPPPENTMKEHSTNDANNGSNQISMSAPTRSNQNYESALPNPAQQTQGTSVNNDFNPWPQPIDPLQQWKHTNESHSNQWLQKKQENKNLPEEHPQQDNAGVVTSSDWQPSRTPAHYSLPNMPPPPPLEAGVEPEERKKSVPTLIPSVLSKDTGMKTSISKTQLSDSRLNMSTPETVSTVASSENVSVQENNEFNSVGDLTEWGKNNSPEELPAKLEQMSLGSKTGKHLEHQSDSSESPAVTAAPVDAWAQSMVPHSTTDHILGVSSDYASTTVEQSQPIDHQANKEHSAQSGYQATNVPPVENVVQSGYDQWYNQNTLPRSSEYPWYSKDLTRPTKDWIAEQNVENYENIQQPTEFVNLEVITPSLQERDIYGSRDSINKETLDNDPKPVINPVKETASTRDFRQEVNNVEVPAVQQPTRSLPPLQPEQVPDNYEFASNDRNTFLETGELTDSHQEHEPTPPSQDDENDEVPNDIPFLREVPGQSSSIDPRRNDPTGQEQYVQSTQRLSDPRRNDPSGQEQGLQLRNITERSERRDIPPGQERSVPMLSRADSDTLERRNDPSGRERSLPPQQSRNDPSGEERQQPQPQIMLESSETREIPGRGNEPEDPSQQTDENLRQIPGGASPNEVAQSVDDRPNGRVVTGSQEVPSAISGLSDQASDSRSKREEAVGASIREAQGASLSSNRIDSYDDENDEGSGNSRDDSRERRRDSSSERRRYEYERKTAYYDRDREYEDEYYYDRRRGAETDRPYNGRDEFDRREMPYVQDDRKHHSRDDLDRHPREDLERRNKSKDDLDDRDSRRRPPDDRRRVDDVRRREKEIRDYDPRYPWDRNYVDRDRRRDDRRPRRYDDYDIRDPYYGDSYSRGSRPSSRSSYNDRDRAYYVRSRDMYYGYNGYPGYDYEAHYANNYYTYMENLRRTNPAAYSEWYHKYYANQHQQQLVSRGVTNYPEDRASVHSGRSSCDDRTTGDKRTLADISMLDDSTSASARMTPSKFSTSHGYGCFSIGSLIHVLPSYPTDGERAKVDILKLDNLLSHDPVTRDLRAYPGPLIKGVTHKKTIIEYCENKIKKAAANEEMADRASYILLYELMIMLIQQNGNVVGVDIAALLLRNKEAYPYESGKKPHDLGRRESVISQRSELGGDGFQSSQDAGVTASEKSENKPRKSIEQITDEFRNTLLYGLVQEALEYAMNEGLWGHALFLASKLDKRTHASVMTRFANSLPYHDPLQTLYQLHSGRVPAVVTGISDPQWDDWRPHLAMIISNTSSNPEINRRSITTLGDTLSARGDIYAAHFCYILSQVDFGTYGTSNVKLVLIGANHHKPYNTFLTTEAVMLTEIYEYARNLSEPGFTLVDLQSFKFDLASKMMDHGLIEKALLYIEQIAVNIANDPSKYKKSFICAVHNLGDRIKYHDPVYKDSTEEDIAVPWFDNLAEIVNKCCSGEIVENGSQAKQEPYGSVQAQDAYETKHPQQLLQQQLQQQQQAQHWNPPQAEYKEGPTSMMDVPSTDVQAEWQPLSLPSNMPETYDQSMQYTRNNDESYQQSQQQDYWSQDTYYQSNYGRNDCSVANWQQQSSTGAPFSSEQGDADNSQLQEKWNYEPLKPAISMTPSARKQFDPLEELDALETPKPSGKQAAASKKLAEKPAEKKPSNSGSSWIGDLFSKFTPKPKNQMILPDDNNPTIVWDPVAKKWTNKDEDGDSGSTTIAPPPKATDMGFRPPLAEQPSQPLQLPQPPSQVDESGINKFKLPKRRSMRANYIDVMNPLGSKSTAAPPNMSTPITSPVVPMATSSPQLFIPAPVNDLNATVTSLTSTSTPVAPSANVSENASQGGPTMYNPSDLKDHSGKPIQPSRYPPR